MTEIAPNLTDDQRLNLLVADYYSANGKGCLNGLADVISGKTVRRAEEISQILGVTKQDVVNVFLAVNALGQQYDREVAFQKLQETFVKGTHGVETTGHTDRDEKITRLAKFASTALDERLKLKESKKN